MLTTNPNRNQPQPQLFVCCPFERGRGTENYSTTCSYPFSTSQLRTHEKREVQKKPIDTHQKKRCQKERDTSYLPLYLGGLFGKQSYPETCQTEFEQLFAAPRPREDCIAFFPLSVHCSPDTALLFQNPGFNTCVIFPLAAEQEQNRSRIVNSLKRVPIHSWNENAGVAKDLHVFFPPLYLFPHFSCVGAGGNLCACSSGRSST